MVEIIRGNRSILYIWIIFQNVASAGIFFFFLFFFNFTLDILLNFKNRDCYFHIQIGEFYTFSR